MTTQTHTKGTIVQVLGAVVDIEFPQDQLPEIYNELRVRPAGSDKDLFLEVEQLLGNNWVRCVAMGRTDGLQRGIEAVDMGAPITMPVGEKTLGRIFNVLGQVVDNKPEAEKVIDRLAMVFGQMNEPPGARLRVALSALTIAEYFRDEEGKDVLLFIDNIFRFTQAGAEVSALLGRMPSAVGYQPNLAEEMGELQERITSTKKGSVTSMQAVYVPADDYTDPAPAT